MKQTQVIVNVFDDLEILDGRHVKADMTVWVGFDDGTGWKQRELDLTNANAEKLRKFLAPFIEAGREFSNAEKANSKRLAHNRNQNPERVAYLAAFRKWAMESNMRNPNDPAGKHWVFQTAGSGKLYYPTWALRQFDTWLEEHPGVSDFRATKVAS